MAYSYHRALKKRIKEPGNRPAGAVQQYSPTITVSYARVASRSAHWGDILHKRGELIRSSFIGSLHAVSCVMPFDFQGPRHIWPNASLLKCLSGKSSK
jgi:hypothetical protein